MDTLRDTGWGSHPDHQQIWEWMISLGSRVKFSDYPIRFSAKTALFKGSSGKEVPES